MAARMLLVLRDSDWLSVAALLLCVRKRYQAHGRERELELTARATETRALSSSRALPEGVDDLPAFTRTHEVQVLDVDVGADCDVRDLAVDVLDFDFEPAIR